METQHEPEDQPESFKVGSQFLIRLNEYEISKGIFIIGHRLVPFRSDRSSVSKLRFEDADGHQIKLRIAGIALTQALQYFAIYGGLFVAKRLFDEDEANGPMIGSAKPSSGPAIIRVRGVFPIARYWNGRAIPLRSICTNSILPSRKPDRPCTAHSPYQGTGRSLISTCASRTLLVGRITTFMSSS